MSWYLVDGSSLLVPIGLRGSWLPRRRKEGTYGLDLVAFSWSNMYNYKCYKCLWWNFEHFSLRSNMNWSAPCVGIMHLAPPLRAGGESLGKAAQLLVFSFSSMSTESFIRWTECRIYKFLKGYNLHQWMLYLVNRDIFIVIIVPLWPQRKRTILRTS